MKTVSDMLKELREDNDLKQSDVAVIIGTSQQQYSKYEKGETELPVRVASVLATHYGVSLDYLTGRTKSVSGVDALNEALAPDYTIGDLSTDLLALDDKDRQDVIEYISLKRMKQSCPKKK